MFGLCSGFACVGCASFKPFWPLAFVQQALAAMFFVVRGLCGHFRFCVLGLTRRSSRPAYCGRLILFVSTTEKPLYSSLCLLKRHSISQALCSAGFVVSPGFACWRCVLQALRCLGGAALFHSSRPSSNPSYRFWLLALTFRSSRPAYSGRLTSPVSI